MGSDGSEDGHPADRLILEKAKRKSGSSSPQQKGAFVFAAQPNKNSKRSTEKKRKRSSSDSSDIWDNDTRQKLNSEPLSLNLDGKGEDRKLGAAEQEENDEQLDFVPPKGVILIGDDEEEVLVRMQRRARAPRYFTQHKFAGSAKKCFNCGKTGHYSRECPNAAKEKPCYICAQFGHPDFACPSSRASSRCFKCNRLGHMARDCPNTQNSLVIPMICTRCGNPDCAASGQPDYVRAEGGCTMNYSASDIQSVQCHVCHKIGHLSCAKTTAPLPEKSCCNCGDTGHLGHQCLERLTYLATREKNEAGNVRGLDSYRSSQSDVSRLGNRDNRGAVNVSQQRSTQSQGVPGHNAGREPAYWQHDRYDPSSHLGGSAGHQPSGIQVREPYRAEEPRQAGFNSLALQVSIQPYQSNPLNSYQSYPPAPITLPPPQPFQHSYQPFTEGAQPAARRKRNPYRR